MKKSDIALLILVVSISAISAYFLGRLVLGDPQNNVAEVEVVEPITVEVVQPSEKIFNSQAVNPFVPSEVGDSSNRQPFEGN